MASRHQRAIEAKSHEDPSAATPTQHLETTSFRDAGLQDIKNLPAIVATSDREAAGSALAEESSALSASPGYPHTCTHRRTADS
mmetsp:Transcript_50562/g.163743  ORF Transcript_50562/g.163743 Transcript_50562/m.163743 type:complete len:84 (+) Transcript_50562:811-1062(+)